MEFLLKDSEFDVIIFDKGTFPKLKEILGALKRLGVRKKIMFLDSLTDIGLQIADFVASSSRYIKTLNAYALPFVKIYKTKI